MHIWTYGLQTLVMKEPEEGNEYDNNAVAMIIDRKTGWHIPKNLSKTFKRLTLPNCTMTCTVIGKHVNHGSGYGLEIPVNFKFFGSAKAIQWSENAVKKVIQNIDQRVKHCKK